MSMSRLEATRRADDSTRISGPYQPASSSMYCKPRSTAKSTHFMAAAMLSCVTRMALPGRIQDVSLMRQGALRLRKSCLLLMRSTAFSPAMMTRHGISYGVMISAVSYIDIPKTLSAVSFSLPRTKSERAASPMAVYSPFGRWSRSGRSLSLHQAGSDFKSFTREYCA